MGHAQSPKEAASPAKQRAAELASGGAEGSAPRKQRHETRSHVSDDEFVVVDAWDSPSPCKKRRRSRSGDAEHNADDASGQKKVEMEEKAQGNGETPKENGRVNGNENAKQKEATSSEKGETADTQPRDQRKDEGERNETLKKGNTEENDEKESESKREANASATKPARIPSPAVHISGVDMVFPEDEVPIELCPFSSDGSVEPPQPEQSTPSKTKPKEERSPDATAATPMTPTTPTAAPADTAPTTPASVTAADSVSQSTTNRSTGRRKRRKKLSYSAPRSKSSKVKQEQNSAPASPALENKLSISVNGHAADNGVAVDSEVTAPPSPVYPKADASHLYPSTPEGEPWRWEDVDSYFDPLTQTDLDNLIRWRKENADFISANQTAWRGVSRLESKRAVLEAMVTDASNTSGGEVKLPLRRGRSYHDVWEETDFLAQRKRNSSLGESHVKSQVAMMKKKRNNAVDAEDALLVSHRDLVYGYDDDLFQEFRNRLEDRVKACKSDTPPATPPTPPMRRQQSTSSKADDGGVDTVEQKFEFDEEVLPSLPIRQLHPASLGLWKLRKNQEPDYSVVHPASLNRLQAPARWKEEMKHHHQQQYELQLQQTDELADPSDGDDEGTGDNTRDRFRATISNSEVTGGLPSFGDCVEEDEISHALAASMSKLIPLSIFNWRTAQLVYERAACSIQCAPILEGEAAAARELEDVFLQLCPPGDTNVDIFPPDSGPTRQPRVSQINSVPHDMIAYSVRHDIAENCSLAVAASVEFALGLSVGDVVDALDRNGCWNYGEVIETYSEDRLRLAKFLLLRFSLWSEDTVEWIAASEGRLLPRGVADGTRPCSVGPTRAHRVRVRYDQNLARELERSFPQRHAKQTSAASKMLAQRQHNVVIRPSTDQQKTPQKRKRKRPGKSAVVTTTT
ncbi:unnamed protein product [Phytophthora lilii]|uniref:Unnamed protein product n=1 Tax=Phytophthora lilii TaxID=2077276 RepID=A0A9W6WUE9_9STRA|nr:unnamed protein product [Phytophthora lilii]